MTSRAEFKDAQAELDALVDANPKEGTGAYDRMELLAILIGAYEAEHVQPPALPTSQEMVQHMANEKGITPGELSEVMGGRSRLSEFYSKKRPLSIRTTKLTL